jgi:hypothetical protein
MASFRDCRVNDGGISLKMSAWMTERRMEMPIK